jgi:Fur family zinc uptake transcriptional regulator
LKEPDHNGDTCDALIAEAKAVFEFSGAQWTEMRALTFKTLVAFNRPASAYEIAENMTIARSRRVAVMSVYRILNLLVAANIVIRVELANGYLPNIHAKCVRDCILLVCSICKRTTHIDDDRITDPIRSVARLFKFSAERPVIEVPGRCNACLALE